MLFFILFIIFIAINASYPELDTNFGQNGKVITDLGRNTGGVNCYHPSMHVVTQPDGKIIIVADIYSNNIFASTEIVDSDFLLIRYNPDGSLDKSFGNQGVVALKISTSEDPDDFAFDIALQKNGKIIVVGQTWQRGGGLSDGVLLRLNQNGSLDQSFGNQGIIIENYYGHIISGFFRVKLQDDEKIIVVGSEGLGAPNADPIEKSYRQFFIARYIKEGKIDTSFGENGYASSPLQDYEMSFIDAIHIQKNGIILVAGATNDVRTADEWKEPLKHTGVVRSYHPDGSLNESFGTKGTVILPNMAILDIIEQEDGKILAVGFSYNAGHNTHCWKIIQLLPNGQLNYDFNKIFNENNPIEGTIQKCAAKNIIVSSTNKILVTGYAELDGKNCFAVACYNEDGSLDENWGNEVKLYTTFDSYHDKSLALSLQDNKLIVVGESFNGTYFNIALARFLL
ncbi:MAG: hypothetical protein AB7R69_01035 [Candidatus Babeliales bacterium]